MKCLAQCLAHGKCLMLGSSATSVINNVIGWMKLESSVDSVVCWSHSNSLMRADCTITSQLCVQGGNTDSLKSATLGVFTLWKLANVTNGDTAPSPPGELVVRHELAHHRLSLLEKEPFISSR